MGIAKLKEKETWENIALYCAVGVICIFTPCIPCYYIVYKDRRRHPQIRRKGCCTPGYTPTFYHLGSPLPRQRALTDTFDATPSHRDQSQVLNTRHQQCLFFQMLPREIRDRIYYAVLGGEILHIWRYPWKIAARWGVGDPNPEDRSPREEALQKRLNVLLTCREMYGFGEHFYFILKKHLQSTGFG